MMCTHTCCCLCVNSLDIFTLFPEGSGMAYAAVATVAIGRGSCVQTIPLLNDESEMDEMTHDQPTIAPYQPNQMLGINAPTAVDQATLTGQPTFPVTMVQLTEEQLSYQRIYQQHLKHLQEQLQLFWERQHLEIEETTDFKNHNLPLARIKKIMKADEDVRMIASEALVLFARACEIFILELTLRAWVQTEENKRRTLQKNDIAAAITRTDVFDFLVDIVPRDEGMFIPVSSVGGPNVPVPYYYMPGQVASAGMIVGSPGDQALLYWQKRFTHVPPNGEQQQQEQETTQQQQPASDELDSSTLA